MACEWPHWRPFLERPCKGWHEYSKAPRLSHPCVGVPQGKPEAVWLESTPWASRRWGDLRAKLVRDTGWDSSAFLGPSAIIVMVIVVTQPWSHIYEICLQRHACPDKWRCMLLEARWWRRVERLDGVVMITIWDPYGFPSLGARSVTLNSFSPRSLFGSYASQALHNLQTLGAVCSSFSPSTCSGFCDMASLSKFIPEPKTAAVSYGVQITVGSTEMICSRRL